MEFTTVVRMTRKELSAASLHLDEDKVGVVGVGAVVLVVVLFVIVVFLLAVVIVLNSSNLPP